MRAVVTVTVALDDGRGVTLSREAELNPKSGAAQVPNLVTRVGEEVGAMFRGGEPTETAAAS